jgi:hypothetical protein
MVLPSPSPLPSPGLVVAHTLMVDELKPLIRHTDRKPQPPKDRRAMIALGHAALTLAELVSAVQTVLADKPLPRAAGSAASPTSRRFVTPGPSPGSNADNLRAPGGDALGRLQGQ